VKNLLMYLSHLGGSIAPALAHSALAKDGRSVCLRCALPVFQAPKLPTIGESVEGPGAVSFAGAGQRGIAQDDGR
jgi:hypothetical protein